VIVYGSSMAKILLIEDDAMFARIYQKKFIKDGHKVVTAKDGHQGLALMKDEQPDVVLLDIMMPELSGLEVLERISADPAKHGIPVIVLTNLDSEEEQERALELGAVAYLVKTEHHPGLVAAKVQEILAATTRGKNLPSAVPLG